MHAIRLHAFGPAENLTLRADRRPRTRPRPGPDRRRRGGRAPPRHRPARGHDRPLPGRPPSCPPIPGREVAGTVDVARRGHRPGPGSASASSPTSASAPGGYAELAVADAARLHEIPAGPRRGRGRRHDRHGPYGDGHPAVRRPRPRRRRRSSRPPPAASAPSSCSTRKNAGATVIGLAGGPEKVAAGREQRRRPRRRLHAARLAGPGPRPPRRPAAATVVFDSVGGDTARAAVDLLGKGGQHIVFGWSGRGPARRRPAHLHRRGARRARHHLRGRPRPA